MARYRFIAAYMMANRRNGTLYAGLTSDLIARVDQHKSGRGSVFTRKYACFSLVWFERYPEMEPAIMMEKRLKRWPRQYKLNLINTFNPDWRDLAPDLSEDIWT